MNVTLRQPMTLAECQRVRIWRNDPSVFPMLRTGYKTEAEQEAFYRQHINPSWFRWVCQRLPRWVFAWFGVEAPARHRYYAVDVFTHFAGITGLTYIEDGEAEISLVLGPPFRGKGIGAAAVTLVLDEARRLGLRSVRGECYPAGAIQFWTQQVVERQPVEAWKTEDGTLHWRWTL